MHVDRLFIEWRGRLNCMPVIHFLVAFFVDALALFTFYDVPCEYVNIFCLVMYMYYVLCIEFIVAYDNCEVIAP